MTASPALTPRQWQILRSVCFGGDRQCGLSACEAAQEIGMKADVLKVSMSEIYRTLEYIGAIPPKGRAAKKTLACIFLWRLDKRMQERRAA